MMSGFEENEISKNAWGGTELTKRGLAKYIDPALLDNFQIMCSRVRNLDPKKIRILWCHDLPEDPELRQLTDPNFRQQFQQIVFTSDWQYQRFQTVLGLPYEEQFIVIESAVEPIEDHDKISKDPINLIYASTPQRGLALLVPAFEHVAKIHPNAHLHVFSSFKMYGWAERDAQFEPLFEQCRKHPQITYHEFPADGSKSNLEVREQMKQSHIFAFPSIWQETFCRTVVEAMSAKLLCIHPNFTALPFTSGNLNIMYPGDRDPQKHINTFAKHMDMAVRIVRDEYEQVKPRLAFNKSYVDTCYSMDTISKKWINNLTQLLKAFPTVESRAVKEPIFYYNTQQVR